MSKRHWLHCVLAVGVVAAILYAIGLPTSTLLIVLIMLACPLLMLAMHRGQQHSRPEHSRPEHGQPSGPRHDYQDLP